MGQKKLIRFAELETFPNVLQFPKNIKGKWNEFFRNEHPIILELACGKGEYAVGLGRSQQDKNFIGIDIKGNRIWVGAKKALTENLQNVAFLRTEIDKLSEYFSKDEVAEIWITFPDPQLRKSKAKKRLTHPKFLRIYREFLNPSGIIHLKTDSPDLYNFTRLVIEMYGCKLTVDHDDLYKQPLLPEELKIKTHYESLDIAKSNRIHYLQFSLPEIFPGKEKDDGLKQKLKSAGRQAGVKTEEFIEGVHYYLNEEGLMVLTEQYHKEKGFCCGMGCLNCPYEYENVPEAKKSFLLEQRKANNKK